MLERTCHREYPYPLLHKHVLFCDPFPAIIIQQHITINH
jgi:hypothetical protein